MAFDEGLVSRIRGEVKIPTSPAPTAHSKSTAPARPHHAHCPYRLYVPTPACVQSQPQKHPWQ